MSKINKKYGPWAVITGSSAGMGIDFAKQLAAQQCNLVLAARREDRLKKLAQELQQKFNIQCRVVAVDLSTEKGGKKLIDNTEDIEVGLLINNAGFATSGNFLESELEKELMMIRLNCLIPTMLAHHYGNKMKARKKGGILFLASVLAYQGVPYLSNYAATKGFNLQLGEGLYHELKKFNIDVHVLSPGATTTEFADVAQMNTAFAMTSKVVVKSGLAILGGSPTVIAGIRNKLTYLSMLGLPRRMRTAIMGAVMSAFRK